MIDVYEHRVKLAAWRVRIKARIGSREREEVAVNEAAARVADKLRAQRHQPFLMPIK